MARIDSLLDDLWRMRILDCEPLRALGIPNSVIRGTRREPPCLAPIREDGQHFALDAGGQPAVVVPVEERVPLVGRTPDDLPWVHIAWWAYDLVAFRPDKASRWRLALGEAEILGHVEPDSPVTLHDTPLDWLRARRRGVVILDWRLDPRRLFDQTPAVRCSPAVARALRDRIAELSRPRFEIIERSPCA